MKKEPADWITKKGKHIPIDENGNIMLNDKSKKKKENNDGRKTTVEKLRELTKLEKGKKKMTAEEKIASVHIDFDKDNILPELDEDTLKKIGVTESKSVLLKSSAIKRNLGKHIDVSDEVMQNIITEALYRPIDVFPANPDNPNYYHLAAFVEVEDKDGLKMGLVLLDTDTSKDNLEIGHAYFVDSKGFDKAKNKTNKKD